MSVSEPFIERPIATSLLMVAVLLLVSSAIASWPFRPCRRWISPRAGHHPVSRRQPSVMSSLVTTPLERQFGQIAGLSSMNSVSFLRRFHHHPAVCPRPQYRRCAQDVQAAINATKGVLPSNLPYPPSTARSTRPIAPILSLAVTSER